MVVTREQLQSCSSRSTIGIPYRLTRHLGCVGKECKGTCQQRRVKDVHTRTTEYLLTDDNGKGRRECHDPAGNTDRHYQGNQKTRNEEALVDLVLTLLRKGELYRKTYNIRYNDVGKSLEEAIPECGQHTLDAGKATYVVHTEQHCGHKSQNYNDHHTLDVVTVADMCALLCYGVRNIKECLEALECRVQETELTAL